MLFVVFAALVLVLSRWQGLRSLVGVLGSLVVIVYFVVPAILDGGSPVGVALVGALLVMFLTIPLTHGVGPKTLAACLGTASALGLTLLVADLATSSARLTGLGSEEGAYLRVAATDVSLSGLLVAGMVIAALGVLDDLTVSQSSTVFALKAANPALTTRELFSRGLVVGRDHVAATVNTLVLAYAGASLPILLIFSLGGWSFRGAVTSEVVAAELVATMVGSIGLVAAVPVTTGLAAFLATRVDSVELEHAHAH
ncbi:MAG TPA: YibE/F family protein [Gaiellaceae bacterium]|nr:YibE/F family protein [Gaiellaceae bacterium]